METLTLTATVVVPKDFTEFASLSEINHRAITYSMMNTIDELKSELKALRSPARPLKKERTTPANELTKDVVTSTEKEVVPKTKRSSTNVPKDVAPVAVAKDTPAPFADVPVAPVDGDMAKVEKAIRKQGVRPLNTKTGKSSKYRLVSHVKRENTYICKVRKDGESIHIGGSKDEIQCALMVDTFLDETGDTKHIRNRDDFPEVAMARKKKLESEKAIGGSKW